MAQRLRALQTALLILFLGIASPFAETFYTWQEDVFTSQERANPAISGPNVSPKGDPHSNLFDYATGGTPFVYPTTPVFSLVPASQGTFAFHYLENPAATDLTYHIELSTDLVRWIAFTPNEPRRTILSETPDLRLLSILNPNVPPFSDKSFQRLRVRLDPGGPNQFHAPSHLSAALEEPLAVLLTWNDNTRIESTTRIERLSGSTFQTVGTLVSDYVTWLDTNVIGSATYTYRVTAQTTIGSSASSNEVTVTLPLDSDGDRLSDHAELTIFNTDPLNADSDGDGMPDGWEVANDLSPRSDLSGVNDANLDPDADGLANIDEFLQGTPPNEGDSDGDGYNDGEEIAVGANPLDPESSNASGERLVGIEIAGENYVPDSQDPYPDIPFTLRKIDAANGRVVKTTQELVQDDLTQTQHIWFGNLDARFRWEFSFPNQVGNIWMTVPLPQDPDQGLLLPANPGFQVTEPPQTFWKSVDPNDLINLLSVQIAPDNGMIGVVGDMVPSNRGETGEKHFVTPKKTPQIDEDYVTFKVTGITLDDFQRLLEWGPAGEPVEGEPLKRRVKRDVEDKTVITVKLKNLGIEATKLNTWVVWASANLLQLPTPVFYQTSGVGLVDGTTADRATFIAGRLEEDALVFEFTIYPIGFCNLEDDIPDLRGAPSVDPPGGNSPLKPFEQLSTGATLKWDDSRAIQITISNPNIPRAKYPVSSALVDNPAILSGQPANKVVLAFPSDDVVGTDDTLGFNLGGNPYVASSSEVPARLRHGIGKMRSDDRPASSISSYLSNNGVYEELNEFREFLRLNIGTKWYRVSNHDYWEFRLRTKKQDQEMIDDGSFSGRRL